MSDASAASESITATSTTTTTESDINKHAPPTSAQLILTTTQTTVLLDDPTPTTTTVTTPSPASLSPASEPKSSDDILSESNESSPSSSPDKETPLISKVTGIGVINNNNCTTDSATLSPHGDTSVHRRPLVEESDEVLTVIVTEKTDETDRSPVDTTTTTSTSSTATLTSNQVPLKSILSNNSTTVTTAATVTTNVNGGPNNNNNHKSNSSNNNQSVKKSVSFDNDYEHELTKFTDGEEIVDQENPFKKFDFDSNNQVSVNLKFIKKNKLNKKSAIPTALPKCKSNDLSVKQQPRAVESDYITKEEILRQSKYVPVYVRHPDRVLTYDKSIIHKLSHVESEVEDVPPPEYRIKRVPIPAPRKAIKPAKPPEPVVKETKKKRFLRSRNSKYPDLSQIKVKTGTDFGESLYDPNEVVINNIKFDSLLRQNKFKSDDDSDETHSGSSREGEPNSSELTTSQDVTDKTIEPDQNGGTYTNTVTSSEFREYLKKRGLILVPTTVTKFNDTQTQNNKKNQIASENNKNRVKFSAVNGGTKQPETPTMNRSNSSEKKSSILRRLFQGSIFSNRKTTPKASLPPQNVFQKPAEQKSSKNTDIIRRTPSKPPRSTVTDFITGGQMRPIKPKQQYQHYNDDDRDSSISSMLTAADYPIGTPKMSPKMSKIKRVAPVSPSTRRSIRSPDHGRLNKPVTFEKQSPTPGKHIIKPSAQRPTVTRTPKIANGSVPRSKPPIPVRTVSEKSNVSPEKNQFNRSYSMDRATIRTRSNKDAPTPPIPVQLPTPRVRTTLEINMNNGNNSSFHPSTPQQQQNSSTLSTQRGPITSTPKESSQIEPNPAPVSPISAIDPYTYVSLHKLKQSTDQAFVNSVQTKPLPPPPLNLRPIEEPLIEPFIRNSPVRTSATGVVGRPPSQPMQQYSNNRLQPAPLQPYRSQSVMDGRIGGYQPNYYTSTNSTPVRQSTPADKKQIMNELYAFYRRSVNNTPVSEVYSQPYYAGSVGSASGDIYGTMPMTRTSNGQPEVPRRPTNYQMRNSINAAIYAYARSISQKTNNNGSGAAGNGLSTLQRSSPLPPPPTQTQSQSQSLPRSQQQQQSNHYTRDFDQQQHQQQHQQQLQSSQRPKDYVVLDSERITPLDVIRHRSLGIVPLKTAAIVHREPVYGNAMVPPHLRNGQVKNYSPGGTINRPSSVTPLQQPNRSSYRAFDNSGRVLRMDGRTTPLVLSMVPPQQTPQSQATYQQSPVRPELTQPRYRQIQMPTQDQQQNSARKLQKQRRPPVSMPYESDTGSEAGEVQRIMYNQIREEDWQNDKSANRNQQNEQVIDDRRRSRSREDPRRHTLGTEMLHYPNTQTLPMQRSMDLEMAANMQKGSRKPPAVRAYVPNNQGPLFDDDPGIMSEVETASTGFRRGNKQRSSLPVVRTPSKTLERPLGLVFLQYRNETKRALLPNEITSIDTVRALFVRSFPRQLSMAYLEGPNVKIYIHDSSKDMFYELEDVRSHLREIKDRSVLRLFESTEVSAPAMLPGGAGVPQPLPQQSGGHWDDPSYFSEPEFDSEYQHQHIHKSKSAKSAPYYVGAIQTLPRGMYSDRNKNAIGAIPQKPIRSYGSRGSLGPQYPYTPDQLYSIPDGYMSSPERGTRGYDEPYYQYGTRGNSVTPVIDEEQNEQALSDDQYAMYGVKTSGRIPRNVNQMYDPSRPEDLHRIRVEHMERQLANLTGLVQKALIQNPQTMPGIAPSQYRMANGAEDDLYVREKPPKLGKTASCHKSVSFEKSVSFSDDIQGTPKPHSPQNLVDSKPSKPAIKSSTLPRMSSQERTLKPAPPPKPLGIAINQYRADLMLAPEVYNHLRGLQKKAKDLRVEVRTLRRIAQSQAIAVREDIKDSFIKIRATLLSSTGSSWGHIDQEKKRLVKEEELYKQEVIRLEKDLGDLESSVEGLRTEVINRRTRVNMSSVEDMALILSRASKTVAELKMRFPLLQQELRTVLATEMEQVCREEKFLKDEPDRLETALRRCKKLTGTLVTLKRLASVQEQRLPNTDVAASEEQPEKQTNKPIPSPRMGTSLTVGGIAPENALDALLDELQTFAKPPNNCEMRDDSASDDSSQTLQNSVKVNHSVHFAQDNGPSSTHSTSNIGLRRLHSYPSGSDTDTSPPQPYRSMGKPPVPERNAELLAKVNSQGKRVPPPPPPRISSRSPLASPTTQNAPPQRAVSFDNDREGNESGNESSGSQDRQLALEIRHQELLRKQRQLQEQYQRLQQLSKNAIPLATDLKKTGSESNIPQKMGMNMSLSGSMKNLSSDRFTTVNEGSDSEGNVTNGGVIRDPTINNSTNSTTTTTTKQVYETEIL